MADNPFIEFKDVSKRFGANEVLRGVNLKIFRGEVTTIIGKSGVGKSVLLGMMTRFTTADITVVGLIGERGREVKEFVQDILGPQGLKKAVVVAAPADAAPLVRIHGAMLATTIAEYFRDQGKNVLLLMDSLSRFAQAQREIGLSISEPPATKGYPPSVFAALPLTAATTGLFDASFFEAVKPGAIFISVGRGASTDTDALVAALQSGQLFGAGLDVTDPEPLPATSPLWQLDNVIITPHVSAAGGNTWGRVALVAVENLRRYVAGEPLLNVVDMEAGY